MTDRAPISGDGRKEHEAKAVEEMKQRLASLEQATKGRPVGGGGPAQYQGGGSNESRRVEGHERLDQRPTEPFLSDDHDKSSDPDKRPPLPPKDQPGTGGDQLNRGTDLADKSP